MAHMLAALQATPFDGERTTWASFTFDVENVLSWAGMTGRTAEEQELARAVTDIMKAACVATNGTLGSIQDEIAKAPRLARGNEALYGILAMCTKGRAKDIVKTEQATRCGAAVWVKLQTRFARAGADVYNEVMRFNWSGPFEDRWRAFGTAVGQLPTPMADEALEALVLEGCQRAGSHALLEALRLRSPQRWGALSQQVDSYLATMRSSVAPHIGPVPMEVDAVVPHKGAGKSWANAGRGRKGVGKGAKGGGKGAQRRHHDRCNRCGGRGHWARECTTARVQVVDRLAPASGAAPAGEAKEEDDQWVFEVRTGAAWDSNALLVDSGAAVHTCPKEFAERYGTPVRGSQQVLVTADGGPLQQYGSCIVDVACGGRTIGITFVISDVSRPIISVGLLQQRGYRVHFGSASFIERGGVQMPLRQCGALYYLDAVPAPRSRGNVSNEGVGNAKRVQTVGAEPDGADEDEEGEQDAQEPKLSPEPAAPTAAERRAHEATHLPYKRWCVPCVMGRGVAKQHRSQPRAERDDDNEVVVQLDYGFIQQRPYLAAVCTRTNVLWARFVPKRGATSEAVNLLVKLVRHLGHVKVVLQADNDAALVELLHAVQSEVCSGKGDADGAAPTKQVRVRTTGGFSSASNGAVERAHALIKGLLRTHVHSLQMRLDKEAGVRTTQLVPEKKKTLTTDEAYVHKDEVQHDEGALRVNVYHNVTEWALRHSAWLLTTHHVAVKDGVTAYQRHCGRPYGGEVTRFCAPVLWLDERPQAGNKLESKWKLGLWLGVMNGNPKHVLLTQGGKVTTSRTIRVQGDDALAEANVGTLAEWVTTCGSSTPPKDSPAPTVDKVVDTVRHTQAAGSSNVRGGEGADGKAAASSEDPEVAQAQAEASMSDVELMTQTEEARAEGRKRNHGFEELVEQLGNMGEKRPKVATVRAGLNVEGDLDETWGDEQSLAGGECCAEEEAVENSGALSTPARAVCTVEVPEAEVDYGDSMWKAAMDAEMKSFEDFGVYEWVDRAAVPEGAHVIGGRWVHTLKNYDLMYYDRNDREAKERAKHKSRYVAQGYSEEKKDTYAATPAFQCVRVLLTLAALMSWSVRTADVSTAFLHAEVSGEVYVKPPQHLQRAGQVWRLKKALYGLRSAPRSWQMHAVAVLGKLGWRRLRVDESVFVLEQDGGLCAAVVMYVDDLLAVGSDVVLDGFYKKLEADVVLKVNHRLGTDGENYLGMRVHKTDAGYGLDPTQYVNKLLEDTGMGDANAAPTPCLARSQATSAPQRLGASEHRAYRRLVGQLLWLANVRRDLSYAVKELSRAVQAPTTLDAQAGRRVLRYLAGTRQLEVRIEPSRSGSGGLQLEAFSDSDWGGCATTRRSTSGGIVMLQGVVMHAWSTTQPTVALSSGEAELVALAKAAQEAMWTRNLLQDMGMPVAVPVVLHTDSSAAKDMTTKCASRVKHLALKYHFVKELVTEGGVQVNKVPTADNPADVLTKAVDTATMMRLRPRLLTAV